MTKQLLFLLLLLAGMSFGQVTVAPITNPRVQFFNNNLPCAGCLLDTFSAGTTNALVTYNESTGTTPNSNPVALGSDGSAVVYLTAASYKFRLRTAAGVTLWTQDNVTWASPLSTFNGITSTGNIIAQPATAATGGANQSSPTLCIDGFYFNVTSLTDQYCWQDVIGTGTNPTNTYTLTHSGSGGTSLVSIVPPFSAAAAKNIGNVQYVAQYTSGSTTCGVQECINALPSTGGKCVLQQGNCSASGWPVIIQKPVVLEGQGMGGPTDPGTNASVIAGSSLTNTSTGNSFVNISLGSGTSLEGVTIRDLALIGNKAVGGATAGDGIDINGGTTAQQVRAISLENVQINQPKGSGIVIQDNAFMISLYNVHIVQAGSHCLVIKNGVNSGIPSQIHIIGSTFDLCGGSNASFNPGTADAINISGSTARSIDIIASTMADSNNGINVVAGATSASVHVTNSDFETNTTCDISLNDGLAHRIMSNTLFGTGTGARGICTAMPVGAAAQTMQLFADGNWFGGHTVQDVTIGANQKTGLFLPQSSSIYTYSDASNNVVKIDVTNGGGMTIAAASGFLPATNGTVPLGSAGLAWSDVITFFTDSTTYRPRLTGHGLIFDAAPTISAGFGTSPSIVNQNGTAAFAINVGTGGTANSGTIGLPTSSNGWVCFCEDQTTTSATVNRCKQTGGTTSTAIIGNFNTTPAAAAWVASDILTVSCLAR